MMASRHWLEYVKKKHPNLLEEVLIVEQVDAMSRDEVITAICKHHPGAGTSEGYSWYIGGMTDTGSWIPEKMRVVSIHHLKELREFLCKLETDKKLSNEWNIENLADYYQVDALPEPRRTEVKNERWTKNAEEQKRLMSKIVEDVENYLMWGKPKQ